MERRSLRDITAIVARAQAEYGGCFACGVDNPIGMRLGGFRLDESGWVEADFVPRPDYRGAHESLHGGISASAVDEILILVWRVRPHLVEENAHSLNSGDASGRRVSRDL